MTPFETQRPGADQDAGQPRGAEMTGSADFRSPGNAPDVAQGQTPGSHQPEGEAPPAQGISAIEQTVIKNQAIEGIRACYDPEIPVNIYELGLVYDVAVGTDGVVTVTMTLTSPNCPAAQSLPRDVEARVGRVKGVTAVRVNVVWSPPWNPSMMSEAAKLELGF
jgi:FeS assembly SUF system protein